MRFPIRRYLSSTMACEDLSVSFFSYKSGYQLLDDLFYGLQSNRTVKTLRIEMVVKLYLFEDFLTNSLLATRQSYPTRIQHDFKNLENCLRDNTTLTQLSLKVISVI